MIMIHVKFQKEGVHCFPEAQANNRPDLADVSFLGWQHFHYFHFECDVQVGHDNREIEFIQFRRWCESLYEQKTLQLNNKSCEMIAQELIDKIVEHYGQRKVRVKVLEDNINGAIVTNWE